MRGESMCKRAPIAYPHAGTLRGPACVHAVISLFIIIIKIVHEVQKDRIRQKKGQNNQHVHKWYAMNLQDKLQVSITVVID